MELGTKEFNYSAMEMFGGKPKQQTAVEWLKEQLNENNEILFISDDLLEQAKEMEKQQIMDALKEGVNFEIDNSHSTQINYKKYFEQYYNETFKNQLQG